MFCGSLTPFYAIITKSLGWGQVLGQCPRWWQVSSSTTLPLGYIHLSPVPDWELDVLTPNPWFATKLATLLCLLSHLNLTSSNFLIYREIGVREGFRSYQLLSNLIPQHLHFWSFWIWWFRFISLHPPPVPTLPLPFWGVAHSELRRQKERHIPSA